MGARQMRGRCGTCAHFRNDAAYLEAAIAGFSSLSSGNGSARADDGLCLLHDRYLGARASCADFSSRGEPESPIRGRVYSGVMTPFFKMILP
jgi:hypothetical protein